MPEEKKENQSDNNRKSRPKSRGNKQSTYTSVDESISSVIKLSLYRGVIRESLLLVCLLVVIGLNTVLAVNVMTLLGDTHERSE